MSSIKKFSLSIFYLFLSKSSIFVKTSLFAFNKKQSDTTSKTNEIVASRSLIYEKSAHNIKFKTKIAKFETKIAEFKTKAAEFMIKIKKFKTKVAAFMTDVTESQKSFKSWRSVMNLSRDNISFAINSDSSTFNIRFKIQTNGIQKAAEGK